MLKLNWLWSEMHSMSPATVEASAAVWQINGVRKAFAEFYGAAYEAMANAGLPEAGLALIHPNALLAAVDLKFKKERRLAWAIFRGVGAALTFQP